MVISQECTRALSAIGLIVFVAVAIFGILHAFGMPMDSDGTMSGCLFVGEVTLCTMSVMEHIALWQNMFAALPHPITAFLLIGLAVILSAAGGALVPSAADQSASVLRRHFDLQYLVSSVRDPIRRAFSQGILHPRIYDPLRS